MQFSSCVLARMNPCHLWVAIRRKGSAKCILIGNRKPRWRAILVIDRLRARDEWKFAGVLRQADRSLSVAWWILLVLRGVLPALFAIAMGGLVHAVQQGGSLAAPLGLVGIVFVLLQVLSPIHQAV